MSHWARRAAWRFEARMRGGHALAADVGDDDGQLAVLAFDHVVVVARDLLAGDVDRLDLARPSKSGQRARQQPGLDLARHGHLLFQLLLGDLLLVQAGVLHLQGHLAGDDGQQLQFVDLVLAVVRALGQGHQPDQPALGDHGNQQLDAVVHQEPLFLDAGLELGLLAGDGLAVVQVLVASTASAQQRLAWSAGCRGQGLEHELLGVADRAAGGGRSPSVVRRIGHRSSGAGRLTEPGQVRSWRAPSAPSHQVDGHAGQVAGPRTGARRPCCSRASRWIRRGISLLNSSIRVGHVVARMVEAAVQAPLQAACAAGHSAAATARVRAGGDQGAGAPAPRTAPCRPATRRRPGRRARSGRSAGRRPGCA